MLSQIYNVSNGKFIENNREKISERKVSISQPWVRPIYKEWQVVPLNIGIKKYISVTKKNRQVDQSS